LQQADLRDAVADLTTWWPEGFDPVAAKVRMVSLEGGEITTQAGPQSATKQGRTGASSGDHTSSLVSLCGALRIWWGAVTWVDFSTWDIARCRNGFSMAIEISSWLPADRRILAKVGHPHRDHDVHEEPDRHRVKDANLD
jgi:hypothetical protein